MRRFNFTQRRNSEKALGKEKRSTHSSDRESFEERRLSVSDDGSLELSDEELGRGIFLTFIREQALSLPCEPDQDQDEYRLLIHYWNILSSSELNGAEAFVLIQESSSAGQKLVADAQNHSFAVLGAQKWKGCLEDPMVNNRLKEYELLNVARSEFSKLRKMLEEKGMHV